MSHIKTILIPLDGSGFAENALPAVSTLAHRTGSSVHLVRVHAQLPLWDVGAELVVLSPDMEQRILEREAAYLRTVARRLEAEGLTVRTAVVKGEIVPALREYAEVHDVDLVVMTSHGWGGVRRAVLGSVADHLLRTAAVPVLIVTPGMVVRSGPDWPSRVLVPLDGPTLAAAALDLVEALDPAGSGEVFLTTVVQTVTPSIMPWVFPPELMLDTTEQREALARSWLADIAGELQGKGRRAYQRIRIGSKVSREVLKVAELERCDLIALASHGAGGMDRVMFGSVADQLVRHSQVPVLVLPDIRSVSRPAPAMAYSTAEVS